ncbi:MAG: hypothetical protein H7210_09560 [Pyrinomonadaceae bacterium]|nr:hypothetical protein [Phycisphaerales bacterium]
MVFPCSSPPSSRLAAFIRLSIAAVPTIAALPALAQPVLNEIQVPSSVLSFTYGGSADGSTAIGLAVRLPSPSEGFRWTSDEGSHFFQAPADVNIIRPTGISGNGTVVVGSASLNQSIGGFRWTQAGGVVPIPDVSPLDISDSGLYEIGVTLQTGQPYRWSQAGGYQYLSASEGSATSISADGSIVVGTQSGLPGSGWRWTQQQGIQPLGPLPAGWNASTPADISPDGSVIVGSFTRTQDAEQLAYRWTQDQGYEILAAFPGSIPTTPNSVAADGRTIVGYGVLNGERFAVIWLPDGSIHRMDDFLASLGTDTTDWSELHDATAISDDGLTIIGNGRHGLRGVEGWTVHVPSPTSAMVLMVLALPRARRARFAN